MPSSIASLLDNVATIMRQTTLAAKVAGGSASGLLSRNLADRTRGVIGIDPKREIPIVGRLLTNTLTHLNVWILPGVLAVTGFFPEALPIMGMAGGAYFALTGLDSVIATYFKKSIFNAARDDIRPITPEMLEQQLFDKGEKTAIVSSNELSVIALSSVAGQPFASQILSVAGVTNGLIIGLHVAVMGIVKIDDAGLYLAQTKGDSFGASAKRSAGRFMAHHSDKIVKYIADGGSLALLTVGGNMLIKHVPLLNHYAQAADKFAASLIHTMPALSASPVIGGIAGWAGTATAAFACNMVAGVTAGLATKYLAVPPLKYAHDYIKPYIAPVMTRVGDFFRRTIDPLIDRLSDIIYEHAGQAFEFIKNKVIKKPVLIRAENFPEIPLSASLPAAREQMPPLRTKDSALAAEIFPGAAYGPDSLSAETILPVSVPGQTPAPP